MAKTYKPPKLNIKQAIKHPGALTRKAKAAGMSNDEFARKHKGDKGQTGAQARFFFTLKKVRPKGKKK